MLILPIKRKWFDMIKSGEKKEEYREIKPYWTKRLQNDGLFECNTKYGFCRPVIFKNGYRKDSPKIFCLCKSEIREGQGKQEWGAEPNKEYYILEILEILEVQNEQ